MDGRSKKSKLPEVKLEKVVEENQDMPRLNVAPELLPSLQSKTQKARNAENQQKNKEISSTKEDAVYFLKIFVSGVVVAIATYYTVPYVYNKYIKKE
jgi:F0F1-type ATP synthase assembly protein I